jgi:O-antigen/teichoic acid export membrane protein
MDSATRVQAANGGARVKRARSGQAPSQLRQILSATAWSAGGSLLGRLFGFIGTLIGARLLGVAGFGAFSFVQSTVSVVNAYAGMGVGTTATRFVAAQGDNEGAAKSVSRRLIGFGFVAATVAAIAVGAGAPWIATTVLQKPELSTAVRAAAFLVLAGVAWESVQGALSGYREFARIALCMASAGIVGVTAIVLLTPALRLPGFILAQAIASLAAIGVGLGVLSYRWRAAAAGSGDEGERLGAMLRFGAVYLASNAILAPVMWLVAWRLSALPLGLEGLGYWGAAHQLKNIVALLPGLVSQVALPLLAFHSVDQETSGFRATLRSSVLVSGIAVLPLGVLLMLFASPLLSLFGTEFRAGAGLAQAVIAGSVCHLFAMPIVHALTIGNVNLTAVVNLIWAGVLLTVVWSLLPAQGALAAGLGWFAAHAASMVLTVLFVRRQRGIDRATLVDMGVVLVICIASLAGLLHGQSWVAWCAAAVACVCSFRWVKELRATPKGA